MQTPDWAERFWSKVDKRGPEECWPWTGGKAGGKDGYGAFYPVQREQGGKQKKATHCIWFLTYGVWPTKWMLHHCDNPGCVNPAHLFEGDIFDNMRDCSRKKRCAFNGKDGELHPWSRLTNQQVREIRAAYIPHSKTSNMYTLAKKYGVTAATICLIINNKTYRAELIR